ncbi:hypothetical protein [Alsobacter soli]|nr:hypothetical protein [Alsobacter soli]
MAKQAVPMAELKRIITAELDRALGAKGTVTNVQIEAAGGDTWRVVEVDTDAERPAFDAIASTVLPKLHGEWGLAHE